LAIGWLYNIVVVFGVCRRSRRNSAVGQNKTGQSLCHRLLREKQVI